MSATSGPEASAIALQKLTVTQLKALCKEKNLVGYSKLTKHAIIQKLIDNEGHTIPSSIKTTASPGASNPPDGGQLRHIATQSETHQIMNNAPELSATISVQRNIDARPHIDGATRPNDPLTSTTVMSSIRVFDLPASSSKRTLASFESLTSPSKKQKHTAALKPTIVQADAYPLPCTPISPEENILPVTGCSPLPSNSTTDKQRNAIKPIIDSVTSPLVQTLQTRTAPTVKPKSKRFLPLVVQQTTDPSRNYSSATALHAPIPSISNPSQKGAMSFTPALNLDFTDFVPVVLQPVSYPPSLSQRKSVPNLALFLSAVPRKDLHTCAHVSRLFRYAVYISAAHRLKRDFPGRRLESVLQQYSPNMTNMWPYLRQREVEVSTRKRIYWASFLYQALKGYDRISERLWTSPDTAKQATVAVRFLLMQLYFSISITNQIGNQFKSKVVDAQELVSGELWSITVASTTSTDIFYVLEATCEVVGRPSPQSPNALNDPPSHPLPIRADWSAYINTHSSSCLSATIPAFTLMSRLKWTNHEEYDRGISRVWLKRTRDQGELGEAKRAVAERYILACIVANSVSGPWMTSVNMAQEFDGMSPYPPKRTQNMHVQLFLPAHHHIESLHFTTSKGEPLHTALAAVQTPGREYYIFRDSGMQVGCEEDGIAWVWTQILECDAYGRPEL